MHRLIASPNMSFRGETSGNGGFLVRYSKSAPKRGLGEHSRATRVVIISYHPGSSWWWTIGWKRVCPIPYTRPSCYRERWSNSVTRRTLIRARSKPSFTNEFTYCKKLSHARLRCFTENGAGYRCQTRLFRDHSGIISAPIQTHP